VRAGSRAPIKSFLLNQKRIAGVGNIYADEALFPRADPPASAGRPVDPSAVGGTHPGHRVDAAGRYRGNGASIDDFRDIDGARGAFQDEFLIHRHEGDPCPQCGGTVRRLVVGGRGTYVCERCQPRPRARRRA